MKKSLAHLPQEKQDEVELIAMKIRALCEGVQMVILFGSYARGDFKDGPHEQGRGKLVIHKRSDYDILVLVANEHTARDVSLWDKVKEELAQTDLSTHVRIIARDIDFVNSKLSQGQYFFTEICEQGIIVYDSGKHKLAGRKKLKPTKAKQIAQANFDEAFTAAKEFYGLYEAALKKAWYKRAAFQLHQAVEHSYKAILLVFTGYSPNEHYLMILGYTAEKHDRALHSIFPRKTAEQEKLFNLLDYAYIGARYDPEYKITKKQLEQLASCVKKLHELTERICVAKIKSLI